MQLSILTTPHRTLSAYFSLPFLTPLVLRNSHQYKLGSQIWFGTIWTSM